LQPDFHREQRKFFGPQTLLAILRLLKCREQDKFERELAVPWWTS